MTLFQYCLLAGAITPEHGRVTIPAEDAPGIMGHAKAKELGLI